MGTNIANRIVLTMQVIWLDGIRDRYRTDRISYIHRHL